MHLLFAQLCTQKIDSNYPQLVTITTLRTNRSGLTPQGVCSFALRFLFREAFGRQITQAFHSPSIAFG